jgi:hypothetical protein
MDFRAAIVGGWTDAPYADPSIAEPSVKRANSDGI